ncbi:MAG: hypothetical protein JXA45_06565 [Methanomassiliicoccales archaeon]|nr:hypothetical protein [Methanomassiliicoccales archaeon]
MVERKRVGGPFSESSRSKFIKRDKEGVASTVGTIMALLVFLTFLALFTNTYIPIWMKENEKNHMDEVLNQFGDLKGKVDSLIVNAQVTGRQTVTMYQPFTLGSDGVPVFATATAGYLFLKSGGSHDSGVSQTFNYTIGGNAIPFDESGGGCMEFYGPNRYYVQQWYAYENGALLIYQEDGMAVRASPSISFVLNSDGSINLQFDQVDIIGGDNSIGGQGSGGANIDLLYHSSQTYYVCGATPGENGEVTMVFKTRYYNAWDNFIQETADEAGLVEGVGQDFSLNVIDTTDDYRPIYTFELVVYNVNEFTHNRAYVNIELEY